MSHESRFGEEAIQGQLFCSITTGRLAREAAAAQERVILAAPGIHKKAAEAFVRTAERLGKEHVFVVLDCTEDVQRLGYGCVEAVRLLRDAGVWLLQSGGLKLGVFICDDRGWVFAPTAQYIEREPQGDETPNAFRLTSSQIDILIERMFPEQPDPALGKPALLAELGTALVTEEHITTVKDALKIAPPVPFDVARQVRVFQPYLQYVDLSLHGGGLRQRQVELSARLKSIIPSDELRRRVRASISLIDRNDSPMAALNRELDEIRDAWTQSLGEPWGRLIKTSRVELFNKRIEEFQKKLADAKEKIAVDLGKAIQKTQDKIIEELIPHLKKNLPEELRAQQCEGPLTTARVREWLGAEFKRITPDPKQLVEDIHLQPHFRAVTYETLKNPEFITAVQKAFPEDNWDKPLKEFNAAGEREYDGVN